MCKVYFILDNLLECFISESCIILIFYLLYTNLVLKKKKINKQVEIYIGTHP